MKSFADLTPAQQAWAIDKARNDLLTAILEGLRFNDAANGGNLQARIDAAVAKADEMQTPWFAHEYIMDTCADDVNGMARASAEDTQYAEAGDAHVETLPADESEVA